MTVHFTPSALRSLADHVEQIAVPNTEGWGKTEVRLNHQQSGETAVWVTIERSEDDDAPPERLISFAHPQGMVGELFGL